MLAQQEEMKYFITISLFNSEDLESASTLSIRGRKVEDKMVPSPRGAGAHKSELSAHLTQKQGTSSDRSPEMPAQSRQTKLLGRRRYLIFY